MDWLISFDFTVYHNTVHWVPPIHFGGSDGKLLFFWIYLVNWRNFWTFNALSLVESCLRSKFPFTINSAEHFVVHGKWYMASGKFANPLGLYVYVKTLVLCMRHIFYRIYRSYYIPWAHSSSALGAFILRGSYTHLRRMFKMSEQKWLFPPQSFFRPQVRSLDPLTFCQNFKSQSLQPPDQRLMGGVGGTVHMGCSYKQRRSPSIRSQHSGTIPSASQPKLGELVLTVVLGWVTPV